MVGLLHDFDYERWPTAEDHPYRGVEVLEGKGYPPWFRRAVLSHAEYTGVTRETPLEKSLFACDELCGFLTACALVNPDKSLRSQTGREYRHRLEGVRRSLGSESSGGVRPVSPALIQPST